jgi:hypothetical protein
MWFGPDAVRRVRRSPLARNRPSVRADGEISEGTSISDALPTVTGASG